MAKKIALTPPKNFEEALAELERTLSEMERGDVALEESLSKYERGNQLIQYCRQVLGQAEKQIELLSKSTGGEIQSTPLDVPPLVP